MAPVPEPPAPVDLELVLDAYIAAWNEADPAARAALLDVALADDAAFDGPTGTFRGRPVISGLVDSIRSRMPGAVVVRKGVAVAGPAGIRFGWQIRIGEGTVVMEGFDEVERARDGRLAVVRMQVGGSA